MQQRPSFTVLSPTGDMQRATSWTVHVRQFGGPHSTLHAAMSSPSQARHPLTLAQVANAIHNALNDDLPAGHVAPLLDGDEIRNLDVPHDNDDAYPNPDETTWIELYAGNRVVKVIKVIRANIDTIWLETDDNRQVCVSFRPRSNRLPISAVISGLPTEDR